jgi:hypothetical protein
VRFVQRVPPATIGRLYFTENSDGNAPTVGWVDIYLRQMQAELVDLAIEHGSPVLADHLKASARAHGSARLTSVIPRMVEQAIALAVARPAVMHPLGVRFRPRVALQLKGEGIRTPGDLVNFCNRRGGSCWRPVPRIGPGRAGTSSLGFGSSMRCPSKRGWPTTSNSLTRWKQPKSYWSMGRSVDWCRSSVWAVGIALSGATGANPWAAFPFIQVRVDLDAVRTYLNR